MNKNEIKALQILEEKSGNGATVSEVASRSKMSEGGALELLKRLKKTGRVDGVQQTAQKVWRFWLTTKGEEELLKEEFKNDSQKKLF